MKKFNVVCDLDGCLFNWLDLARKYFPNIPKEPMLYNLSEFLISEEKIKFQLFNKSAYVVPEIQLYEGAMDFIIWLHNTFDTVYFVTGRDKNQERVTRKCFKELGLAQDKLIFEKDKYKLIPDMGVLISIEDDPRILDNLKKFKDLYLVVPTRSWNQAWIKYNIGEFRVYPWTSYDMAKQQIEHIVAIQGEE